MARLWSEGMADLSRGRGRSGPPESIADGPGAGPGAGGPSEAHPDSDPHASPFLPHPRIVHRNPVLLSVAVGVLQVGAASATGLRVVDEVVVAHLVDERIG